MKKLFVVVAIAAVLVSFVPCARAQTSFILGFGAGLLFADGDKTGGATIGLLYTMPRVSERVRDPLAMRLSSIEENFAGAFGYCSGAMVKELFEKALPNNSTRKFRASDYEILQVARVVNGANPGRAAIWFVYIEKNQVIPLEQLKP